MFPVSMETARDRFFNTPELLDLVATILEPIDISRLCRTSHRIHQSCTPSLYRDLFISSCYGREQKIFASTPCLLALGRNIRHVRKLILGPTELHYYYNCLLAFEDIRALDQFSSTAIPPSLPQWLPPEDYRTCRVVPVPPITNLQYLELTDQAAVDCSYQLPHFLDDRELMAELSWLISLNPRLEYLESCLDAKMDLLGCRLLGKAVAGLSRLTMLDLMIVCDPDLQFQAGAEIFFNCCPLISKFALTAVQSFNSEELSEWDLDGVPEDAEWRVECRKQEPLTNLVEMHLWEVTNSTSADELLTVFARCPNLRQLNIQNFPDRYDHAVLGEYIGRECPKIRSLSCGWRGMPPRRTGGPLLFRIMESLPRQTVEDISFHGFHDSFIELSFTPVILRHSTTLTKIDIDWTGLLVKISVSAIFGECVNLKELHIRRTEWPGRLEGLYTTLTDILERQWVTTQLSNLTLFVSVCDLPIVFQEQREVVISQMREAHFERLKELNSRIMALPEGGPVEVELVVVAVEGEDQQLIFIALNETPLSP
ncbi:hypothetical protein F5H01DRAFT_57435 [Linnemannia elongata]|nr:hypothetical protein F5H01DRAFT_57435 [Linnemannia elongata]